MEPHPCPLKPVSFSTCISNDVSFNFFFERNIERDLAGVFAHCAASRSRDPTANYRMNGSQPTASSSKSLSSHKAPTIPMERYNLVRVFGNYPPVLLLIIISGKVEACQGFPRCRRELAAKDI